MKSLPHKHRDPGSTTKATWKRWTRLHILNFSTVEAETEDHSGSRAGQPRLLCEPQFTVREKQMAICVNLQNLEAIMNEIRLTQRDTYYITYVQAPEQSGSRVQCWLEG